MDQAQLQQTYKGALESLSQENYEKSTAALREILQSGFESADTHYYLGRSLFMEGQVGESVHHFQRSVRLERLNTEYREALEIAQNQVPAGFGRSLEHPWEWAAALESYIRPEEAFFLCALFASAYLFVRYFDLRKLVLRVSLISFSLLLFMVAAFGSFSDRISTLTETGALRAAPLDSARELRELNAGVRVQVLRRESQYSEIQRGNTRGWVKTALLSP